MRFVRGIFAFGLFVFIAGAAQAASERDLDDCDRVADLDRRIVGCTAVIRDQRESEQNRIFAFTRRGIAYANKGDYDRAISDYNEAIRLDPKLATAYYNRGRAYHRKSDYDRAIADYTEAIRINPKYAMAFSNRGAVYYLKEDDDRAIADYNAAIRLAPKLAEPFYNRGLVYRAKGDNDRAIADFKKALDLGYQDAREELRELGVTR